MRSHFQPESPINQRVASTEGYTPGVNNRQHRTFAGLAALLSLLVGMTSTASAQDAKPAKPASGKAATPAVLVPPPVETAESRAGKGVVVLQRAGLPVGLGMVLSGDGRILTALSPLGSGNDLEAKFADDSVHKVKLGHHDRVWDLALLVPQSGRWKEGLTASSANPLREDMAVKAFSIPNRGKPAATAVDVRSKRSLIGGDDQMLMNALEIGSRIQSRDLGSPMIDDKGRVLGILGRACLPGEGEKACAPVAFGIPVSAIKSFLKTVPADAVAPQAWLGIQGAADQSEVVKGVRVLSVAKGSPASLGKLKAGEKGIGDLIVAVGGEPVTTPEQLAAAVKKRAIGEKVPLTLFSKGKYRQAEIVLKSPPEAVAAPATAGNSNKLAGDKSKPGKAVPAPAAKPRPKVKPAPAPEPEESDPFAEPL